MRKETGMPTATQNAGRLRKNTKSTPNTRRMPERALPEIMESCAPSRRQMLAISSISTPVGNVGRVSANQFWTMRSA